MNAQGLYHGGFPGLKPGDLLEPGHGRQHHDGCPWCEARKTGGAFLGMDGPSGRREVYFTPVRLYAKFHASLYGYGDLYRVEPVGRASLSLEDSVETWSAPKARVLSVYDRAVRLTDTERRALDKIWREADLEYLKGSIK
jgi:hypothetical protein